MTRARKAPFAAGHRLGANLTVLGAIDPGALEPVYIVWHAKAWCHMACKVFPSSALAAKEAGVMGRMSHPFILPTLGVEEPGCLLMPFLEGRSVANMLDSTSTHRFTISNAMRVALHVGAALQHVHERGYIHLDVKPDNVIVAAGGRPVLFDFGSARAIADKRPRAVIGTNAYIAPEECQRGRTGPEADVFSLGVMLHEMIAGDLPFGRGNKNAPWPQLAKSAIPLREVRRSVLAGLERLVLSCLDREPARRPALSELLPQLNGFISNGPKMWPEDFVPHGGEFFANKNRSRVSAKSATAAAQRNVNGLGGAPAAI